MRTNSPKQRCPTLKYLRKKISAYLLKNKLIATYQYGFCENYSTSLALATILNEIISNIDDKKITYTIFLDLAKAFDTVDHFILINSMEFVDLLLNC